MIRFILCVIVVVGFLILSIPILLVEWIIGKFNPMAKEINKKLVELRKDGSIGEISKKYFEKDISIPVQ